MRHTYKSLFVGSALLLSVSSCNFFEVEKVDDPNNPTVESVLNNASAAQIAQLGVGIQNVMRNGFTTQYQISGAIGREVIQSASTDNRYFTEILGTQPLDPAGIFFPWYNSYSQTRRQAEIFLLSAEATSNLTVEQKAGVRGFARTVQAFASLNLLNMMGNTGIRTTFTDLNNPGDLLRPGPFSNYETGLAYVKSLVDDGASSLDKSGAAFAFPMTAGWTGFTTPTTFRRFNRALAARVAMYQKDWATMNTALSQSFLDLNGSMTTGPTFRYSTTAGDATNPLFQNRNTSGAPIVVQRNFISEAEAGDTRLTAKTSRRTNPRASGNIPASEFEVFMYANNTAPISIIRNEELILMAAEVAVQQNRLADAVTALDKVRVAAGLQPLATAKPTVVGNQARLIDEVLNQRRYSLFYEGHRWFDMRRYDRLAQIPKDLPTHNVFREFPKPDAEVQWDARYK